MQIVRHFDADFATQVGFGLRILQIGALESGQPIATLLQRLGGRMQHMAELYAGMEEIINDPADYGLCVIDCDTVGGLDEGRRAAILLCESMATIPVILVSSECRTQEFPAMRNRPVVLRSPVSTISMRVGFEHAMRDKIAIRMI